MKQWLGAAMAAIVACAGTGVPRAVAASRPLPCSPQASECNVEYVHGGRARHQVLDVFYASRASSTLRPAVVFVHGGGWWGGDKVEFAQQPLRAPQAVAGRGWVAFTVDYRLADDPDVPGPGDTPAPMIDQPQDVARAVQWVKRNAPRYGVDPNRVALVGASAGAHLALVTAFTHAAPRDPLRVRTVVSWAGPTDLVTLALAHPCPTAGGIPCPPGEQPALGEMLRRFAGGCTLAECPTTYRRLSPVDLATATAPPTLLYRGVADYTVPAEQADEMASKLRRVGASADVAGCATTDAGGTPLPCSHYTIAIDAWRDTLAFLTRRL